MHITDDRYRVSAFGDRAGVHGYRITRRLSRTIVAQYLPDIFEPNGRRHMLKLAKIERWWLNRGERI